MNQATSEPIEPIVVTRHDDGTYHLAGDWPARTAISDAFLESAGGVVRTDGDGLIITLANASARYRITAHDSRAGVSYAERIED